MVLQQVKAAKERKWCTGAATGGSSKWKQQSRCSGASTDGSNKDDECSGAASGESNKVDAVVLQHVEVAEKIQWCCNRPKQQRRGRGATAGGNIKDDWT